MSDERAFVFKDYSSSLVFDSEAEAIEVAELLKSRGTMSGSVNIVPDPMMKRWTVTQFFRALTEDKRRD